MSSETAPRTSRGPVRRYRALVIPMVGIAVLLIGFVSFNLLNDSLVFFKTPTEALEEPQVDGERFRLGGQVEPGTVVQFPDRVEFLVGDGTAVVPVVHEGAPAQLFQEGIGIVVEGSWATGSEAAVFRSDTMLIKHDEQYRTEDGGVYKPPAGTGETP
jgi:cytochrome c-type biogenesis protein CcmE